MKPSGSSRLRARIEGVDLSTKGQHELPKFLKVLLRRFRVVAAKVARQLNCGGVARVSWAFASLAESEGRIRWLGEVTLRLIRTDPLI